MYRPRDCFYGDGIAKCRHLFPTVSGSFDGGLLTSLQHITDLQFSGLYDSLKGSCFIPHVSICDRQCAADI